MKKYKAPMIKKILMVYILFFASLSVASSAAHKEDTVMNSTEMATFAGGCFWCMQPAFDKLVGVVSTTVGYTGGQIVNPTYEEVSAGNTGHVEALQVLYNPSIISYKDLLAVFWHQIDPLNANGQFCDVGLQYRSIIFYHTDVQKKDAMESERLVQDLLEKPVVTNIIPATTFYPAEEYHQKYYLKNPIRYHFYRYNCGRDERLKEIWGGI